MHTSTRGEKVVIVGAGHAGGTMAGILRQQGFTGAITLIGDEPDAPYHRPPLSKKFTDPSMVQWLKPAEFYVENNIDLVLGHRVTGVDPTGRTVELDDGRIIDYSALVLATGASPRRLPVPGADLPKVLTLRTLTDARRLGAGLRDARSVAIVGGGYIGMEVAAVARSKGIAATIIEREDRILARVASSRLSAFLCDYHTARGTTILTGRDVTAFEESGPTISIVSSTAHTLSADVVVVGVGAVPNQELAQQCGARCSPLGIVVDRVGNTDVPGVLAIGDVTHRPHDRLDGLHRMESIPSAVEQAKAAAATILRSAAGTHETPWFWSDQFDLKLKIAGILEAGTTTIERASSAQPESFALFHLRPDDTVCAVETCNSPGDFMAGKKLIADRLPVDARLLSDPDRTMREVLDQAKTASVSVK